jgi:hypothetical protein
MTVHQQQTSEEDVHTAVCLHVHYSAFGSQPHDAVYVCMSADISAAVSIVSHAGSFRVGKRHQKIIDAAVSRT